MSPPYVMLADVPEAERDLLLDNLTNGRAIAEGILANLARWVRLFERPKDAFPVSMEHEPVPQAYWLEAASGRASIFFDQNAVFSSHQGYLYVRVSQPETSIVSTGKPGRPSKGKEAIASEFDRRAAANECEPSLAGEARALRRWFEAHQPLVEPPDLKTIENNIRPAYCQWTERTGPTK